jgi:hypothetical protein
MPVIAPVRPVAPPSAPPPVEAGAPAPAMQARLSLTERIHAAAESQIGAVEAILTKLGGGDVESETAARALATTARTLRELMAFDAAQQNDSAHDTRVPRSLDELRRSLSAKLDRIIAERTDPVPGGPG